MVLSRLLSKRYIFIFLVIAVAYTIVSIYLMNIKLVYTTITGSYTIRYKVSLLTALLYGVQTSMSVGAQITLAVTAILTGLNVSFLMARSRLNEGQGKQKWLVGSSSVLGATIGGCAACGIPLIALIGTSSSLVYLPFIRDSISYVSYSVITMLIISFYSLIRGVKNTSCGVRSKK